MNHSNTRKTLSQHLTQKLKKTLGKVGFISDIVGMYYCLRDPSTPFYIKMFIYSAIAYFIFPIDIFPDIFIGVGYIDDAITIAIIYKLIKSHLTDAHHRKSSEWLNSEDNLKGKTIIDLDESEWKKVDH